MKKGYNSYKVSAEAKFIWIMPNRRRICDIAQHLRTKMVKVRNFSYFWSKFKLMNYEKGIVGIFICA